MSQKIVFQLYLAKTDPRSSLFLQHLSFLFRLTYENRTQNYDTEVTEKYVCMYVCMYIRLKQLTNRNTDNTDNKRK